MKPILSLPGGNRLEERKVGLLVVLELGIVAADHVVGERPDGLHVAAGGEELEGADANMARRDAGEDGAGQDLLPVHRLSGDGCGERPGRRHPERVHRLADDIFAQHRSQRCPSVAAAGIGRLARPLELDVAAAAMPVDHLPKQDRAAVAELRHEGAELVPGIGHGERFGALRHLVAGEDRRPVPFERLDIEPELFGKRPVELDQPGLGDRRRFDARVEIRRQPRIAVVEGERRRLGRRRGCIIHHHPAAPC